MSALVYITAPDFHLCEHGRDVLDRLEVERREISAESDEAAELELDRLLIVKGRASDGRAAIER